MVVDVEPGIKIFGKKGTAWVLNALRHVPRRYNAIKAVVVPAISARTLDTRLADLVAGGWLAVEMLPDETPPGKEYRLTPRGRCAWALFRALPALLAAAGPAPDPGRDPDRGVERDPERGAERGAKPAGPLRPARGQAPAPPALAPGPCARFEAAFAAARAELASLNWDCVWARLQASLARDPVLRTPGHGRVNEVTGLTAGGTALVVETRKGVDRVPVRDVQSVWGHLLAAGILYRDDHARATYRSSFIFSLLARLPGTSLRTAPKIHLVLVPPTPADP